MSDILREALEKIQEVTSAALQANAESGSSKPLPIGQGPELTREQIEANWQAMQPTWQPILDSLTGKAP